MNALVKNVASRCGCDFTEDHITDPVFQCYPSSPQSVTYHAQLHGTLNTNVQELIRYMEDWASTGVTIPVQLLPLTVSSICEVDSSTAQEHCPGEVTTTVTSTSGPSSTTPIITAVSVIIIIAIVIAVATTLLIAYTRYRHSSGKYKTTK